MRPFSLLIALVFTAVLTNCSSPAPVGSPVTWPKQSFSTVKAYAYHCDAEPGRDFIQTSGRYHIGILKPGPVELSPDQVQRLLAAITVPQAKSRRTPCYVPHHAFVFFDAKGRRVANLDICFTCNKFRAFPEGVVEYPDMHRLYALVQELGLPTGTGKYFYRDLYEQQGGQLRLR
jgi:hypothetical protein